MQTIKPKKLTKGNTIGIIAVSGRIKDFNRILNAKSFFENQGYNVKISQSCKSEHRYMAGKNDNECIKTLHEFFENENINAIVCARGGYGALRLLEGIDWNIIKNNPKIFAGYSDITILLNMVYKKTGLITFHSAMPNGDFSGEISDYTKNSFFETLAGIKKEYTAQNNFVFYGGMAKGRLWGGNLSSLVSLCGTDFIPDEDLILFLEDLNEPVYKIDRMLTQIFNIKKIRKNVKGIALGEFQNVENIGFLEELLQETALKLKVPVCCGFKITHGKIKDTVPIGIQTKFNADEGIIKIKEQYVS